MFKLDQEIADWRRRMVAVGIKTHALLDELENHLRDDIEQQVQTGLNEQQAFRMAIQQIGEPTSLRSEFDKVGEPGNTLNRKAIFIYYAGAVFYALIGIYLFVLAHDRFTLAERLSGLIAIAITVLLLSSAGYSYRILPALSKRTRTIVGVVCSFLGVAVTTTFMNFILPLLNLPSGQVAVTTLWAMLPIAMVSSVLFGLQSASNRQNRAC